MRSSVENTPPSKGARQKRFIRFRTLGAGYSEEELKAVNLWGSRTPSPAEAEAHRTGTKVSDAGGHSGKAGRGKEHGYARWAKRYNLKEMSKTLISYRRTKSEALRKCRSV